MVADGDRVDRIQLALSGDLLEARLTISAGPPGSLTSLTMALQKANVMAGIDRSLLATIGESLADESYTAHTMIAEGMAPEHGIDGKIVPAIDTRPKPGHARADGSLDYHDRNSLTSVIEGDLLVTIVPPTKGKNGFTVTGEALPARDGSQANLALGSGVERVEDRLCAKRDGVLSYIPGSRIDVVRMVEHKADIDYASGNLEVEGSVVVTGDIQPEFTIVATDDVIIKGSVEDGIVFAGNSIRVSGGVMGTFAELVARSDLQCRHTRKARLIAGGRLEISDHSVNSLLAGSEVFAMQGRGAIIGGTVYAKTRICLREAGSPALTPTILAVAMTPSHQATLLQSPQEQHAQEGSSQAPKVVEEGLSLKETDRIAATRRAEIKERQRLLTGARIEISGIAHAGTLIRFGDHELLIKDSMQAPIFVFDETSMSIVATGN